MAAITELLKRLAGGFAQSTPTALGMGGAALGTSLAFDAFSPDEAEAAGFSYKGLDKLIGDTLARKYPTFKDAIKHGGELRPMARKSGMVEPQESSTNALLQGTNFRGGTIAGTYQGPGNKRFIHMQDGTIFPTDSYTLNMLAREAGSLQRAQTFATASEPQRQQMAMSALKKHEEWNAKQVKKSDRVNRTNAELLDTLAMHDLDEGLTGKVMVQSMRTKKWFPLLREYVPYLEQQGLIKVDPKWRMPSGPKK